MSNSNQPSLDLTAQCACGDVTVRLNGRVAAMLLCSCLDCQKASGTGHATFAMVPQTSVTLIGEHRSFDRPADSGAVLTRTFCARCGTPLAGASSRAPNMLMLPVGLFGKDAGWFEPSQLIFARSHHDWDAVAEGLPMHETYRQAEPKA